VVESLISSCIEDHTFGPMNLREHFPEEDLGRRAGKTINIWVISWLVS